MAQNTKVNNNRIGIWGLAALVLAQLSFNALAGEKENRIIDNSVQAYGGERLKQLAGLSWKDEILHYFEMQSGHSLQGPTSAHLNRYQIEVGIDFVNQAKAFRRATTRLVGNHDRENLTTTHQVFTDGKGFAIDHCLQTYRPKSNINFANADWGFSQMLDTLIIKQLMEDKQDAEWRDTAYIQGQAHHVLTVYADTAQEYTLYLNKASGLLTRMLKKRGDQTRHFEFLDHQAQDGIVWAGQMMVSADSKPIYHTDSRKIELANHYKQLLELPNAYQQANTPQYVDVSKMTIRQLADGVYFAGQDWGYTLFVDLGESYLSVGAWGPENNFDAWQRALALLNETTGQESANQVSTKQGSKSQNKTVSHHLVTHHHRDHMSGLNDIVVQGAKLIAHPADIPGIQQHLAKSLADERFMPVSGTQHLAEGKILLFDVPNSHANHNLVLYLPEHNILFTEDMFGSSQEHEFDSPNGWPDLDAYQRLKILTSKLKEMNLPVDQYVSSHHARILSQSEIDRALGVACPSKEELTRRLFEQAPTGTANGSHTGSNAEVAVP